MTVVQWSLFLRGISITPRQGLFSAYRTRLFDKPERYPPKAWPVFGMMQGIGVHAQTVSLLVGERKFCPGAVCDVWYENQGPIMRRGFASPVGHRRHSNISRLPLPPSAVGVFVFGMLLCSTVETRVITALASV